MDDTRNVGYYGDADLGEFLARPVKIHDFDWTVSTGDFSATIDPWSLFLEDSRVKDRVENYRLLQGKLNIRVAINGGPFYYGKAIVAYNPRPNEQIFATADSADPAYITQLSQLPHVFLDPTTSEGGSMQLPFFNPDNWIDIPGQTYKDMGELVFHSINDLLHANSSTGKVSITVYAWMENVRLAAPTTFDYGAYDQQSGVETVSLASALAACVAAFLAWASHCHLLIKYTGTDPAPEPQSGDEYGTGIISKPASVIAKTMGMLSQIPAIRPFARPSEMVASTVGRVAHVFGYSRPAIISDLQKVKIKGAGHLACTDQHEAVTKLALDSKQELSVDPRTVGLSDVDEMAIDYIKQKEAYATSLEWSEGDDSGTELGQLVVGPDYLNRSNDYNFLLPTYVVAAPFSYWRGSMKYRFQLVASQMHRGRIKITYDPCGDSATEPENGMYTRIIDLATNRDFEMSVAWNHSRPWLAVLNRTSNGISSSHTAPGMTVVHNNINHNGMIKISVVNELTSPNPSLAQPVYINVFVSGGEDLEFGAPNDGLISQLTYYPQSGYEPQDGEELVEEQDDIPESPPQLDAIGTEAPLLDKNLHVFFGEVPRSIRALMKRYCYHQAYNNDSATLSYTVTDTSFPIYRGDAPGARHETTGSGTWNYVGNTYLNYFTPCYLGWKGSLRSKFIPEDRGFGGTLQIRRLNQGIFLDGSTHVNRTSRTDDISTLNRSMSTILDSTNGHDVAHNLVDGSLEVEFPFYCYRRFAPARFHIGQGANAQEAQWGNDFGFILYSSVAQCTINRYVAAGDDFSLFFWVGMPGVRRATSPALAA